MKQIGYTIVCVTVQMLGAQTACAQDNTGFYASANAGIGVLGSEDLNYRDTTVSGSAEGDFEASIAAGGTLGYRLNDRWRIEGEMMYRRNDLEAVTINGIGAATEGDYASLSVGLGALYDFRPFPDDKWSAYVGGGIVFVQEIDIDFEVDGVETSFETDDIGFQLQLGARYEINRNLFAEAGVRYMTLSDVQMEFEADSTRMVEADYSPLTFSVGLGWQF